MFRRGQEVVQAMASIYRDPAHWRARAGKTREIAAQLRDPEDKVLLGTIAESYDRLAAIADDQVAASGAPQIA
jgi:hypothetical protein